MSIIVGVAILALLIKVYRMLSKLVDHMNRRETMRRHPSSGGRW